ncbi:MAG TPA: hypothetical protein VHC19_03035 [Pirellulales bacterium]|nr:hypothetical protein [Pirellulales bacterium]
MNRSLVLLLAPLFAAGCHNASQATDPFLPRTTVPPPATGAAVGGATAAPYYPGPAGGTAAPPASNNFYPPGDSYNYPSAVPGSAPPSGPPAPRATDNWPMTRRNNGDKQSSTSSAAGTATVAIHSPGDSGAAAQEPDVTLASAETETSHPSRPAGGSNEVKIVRVVAPAAGSSSDAVAANAPAEPRRLPASDEAIDIMDLPPARKSSSPQASRRIALASNEEPAPNAESSAAGGADPERAGRYAYAPDYRWLKGQLEYSLVDHTWKLRYIPIDGDTDPYGGSVVLEGSVPAEFQAGEFVTIYGSLSGDAAAGHFAPKYRLDSITPLAE